MIIAAMNEHMIDKKALQLASRFAFGPNAAHLCGPEISDKMRKCIIEGDCDSLDKEFDKFPDLNAYINTISTAAGFPPFSYPVMEAYWFGNQLLNQAKPEHYAVLLRKYRTQKTISPLVDLLALKKPTHFVPNHLFHVLNINMDSTDIENPLNLKIINHCMVRWGDVTRLDPKEATLNINSLTRINGQFGMAMKTETLPIDQDFVGGLELGDTVAVHLKMMAKILTTTETSRLAFWTKKTLECFS